MHLEELKLVLEHKETRGWWMDTDIEGTLKDMASCGDNLKTGLFSLVKDKMRVIEI